MNLDNYIGKKLKNIPKSIRTKLGDGVPMSKEITVIEHDNEGGFFDSTGAWIIETPKGKEVEVGETVLKEAIEKSEVEE